MDAMKRRGFLGRFAATVAGLSILPTKAKAEPAAGPKSLHRPNILITQALIAKAFMFEFHKALKGHRTVYRPYSLQDEGEKRLNLHVETADLPNDWSEALNRYIEPAAETLAEYFKFRGMNTCHELASMSNGVESTVVKSNQFGLCIRVTRQYNLDLNGFTYLFEVLAS